MPQVSLPMINIADFCFNVGCVIAIDLTRYTNEIDAADYPKRAITLTLVGPTLHTFKGARADNLFDWYLRLTNQAPLQSLVSFPDRAGSH